MMRYRMTCGLVVLTLLFSGHSLSNELHSYQKVASLSGNLSSIGSDSLAEIMTSWAEEFSAYYPDVNVQVQASGSTTAVPALIQGTAQMGPMSRPMQTSELDAFEKVYGYQPTALVVAYDALAVYVHQDNPIRGLNFIQLDAIFSSTYFCGTTRRIDTWSDLGIIQPWGKLNIQRFGRNSVSGTHGVFKNQVLCNGDFSRSVNELPGGAAVVQTVASSPSAIGYSGVTSKVVGARQVPLDDFGHDYKLPTKLNILSGAYPLTRKLYIYINKPPQKPLDKGLSEFLRYIYSRDGQNVVARDGYIAVSGDFAQAELVKVGL